MPTLRSLTLFLFTFFALVAPRLAHAIEIKRDIEYARIGDTPLQLDLYLPEKAHPPLVVYIHGGAWRGGAKSDCPLAPLAHDGFAVASIDYRLSTQAPFPAQVHDIKAAIRFLRAEQAHLGIDATRIVIAGSSAGGHLAALVGVTNGHKELEGAIGQHLEASSDVQGIISLFGASDLLTILDQSTDHGRSVRIPALQLLLGGQPTEKPDLAKLASPIQHIDAHDPPLLLLHGDADPQMPPEQSKELAAAYEKAGRSVKLVILPGAAHGGKVFYDAERMALMKSFLESIGSK